jgi:hypothetical protein
MSTCWYHYFRLRCEEKWTPAFSCVHFVFGLCVASRKAVSNRPAILSARFFFVALSRSNSTREISIFGSRGVARKGNTHVRRRGSFCCKWKKCTGLALVARQAKYCNDLWLHIGACNRLICTRRAVRLLTAPTTQAFSPFHRPAHTTSPQGSVILFPTKDQVLLWQTLIANYPYSDNNGNETRQVRCRLFQKTNFINIVLFTVLFNYLMLFYLLWCIVIYKTK